MLFCCAAKLRGEKSFTFRHHIIVIIVKIAENVNREKGAQMTGVQRLPLQGKAFCVLRQRSFFALPGSPQIILRQL